MQRVEAAEKDLNPIPEFFLPTRLWQASKSAYLYI